MNQTFSFSRFARLHRWLWATKSRTYLFGALALIPLIMLIPSQVLRDTYLSYIVVHRNNIVYFIFLAQIVTFSIGSDVFSTLFRQDSAIAYLMIPASRAEKFWLGVLYCIVALLLLALAYFSFEAVAFSIANNRLPASEAGKYAPTLALNASVSGDRDFLFLICYSILFSLILSLLGSFFFRRGVFIRNVGVVLLSSIALLFLYRWIVSSQSGGQGVGTALPFYQIAVHTSEHTYELLGPPNWLKYGAYAGTLLMLWVIARIRFNEIER
ncbi:hypothetical protein A6C57_21600 [Fibrella sp. ES10-3-2-2]|nr:hypothetical protein A6C57_21600 [Fibrella sp. ES10-3-2-2]